MTLYTFVLFVHVVTAVLGLGQVSLLGLLAQESFATKPALLERLLRAGSGSLAVMLISGGILTWMVNGSFAQMWWFRLSIILFLLLGFLLGRGRRILRTATASSGSENLQHPSAFDGLRRLSWAMSATIAAIVFLMEAKPF